MKRDETGDTQLLDQLATEAAIVGPGAYDAMKVIGLFRRLAGEKMAVVACTAQRLYGEGKDLARALADALEQHKLPGTFPDVTK